MGTRNPAYSDDHLGRTDISLGPMMSSYAKDTPITDPVLSYSHEDPEHTYLAPRIPGYNTDDVILQCKERNIYDALGKYSTDHKVEAMKRKNLCYESTQVARRPKEPKSSASRGKKRSHCCLVFILVLVCFIASGALTVTFLQYFGILKYKENNTATGSVQGSTGASTGVADSEWMKRLESNITELKQRIAPQEQQIVFLKNSTKENEKVINSLKEALELEQAKNRALNQTVKSYETRLKNEERKTSSHNQTLLQLRALHDALKNTTTSSTQSLAANIEEIDKRLQIVLSTMQGLNQTSRLDGIQSMIVEESQFRQSNDSALSQLIKENAMTRQQSIANLTADISTVQTASNQNIHNLEARLNSSINTKVAMLQTDDQTLFSQVSNVNQSILHMIRNISLTPGPQGPIGPAGPGNLTGCREKSSSTQTTSSTSVRASLNYDNVSRIVVGVLCHATLPAGIEVYSVSASEMGCKCNVPSASGATWTCWLRLWTCPKVS